MYLCKDAILNSQLIMDKSEKVALIISDNGMGVGADELKMTLVTNYLSLLVDEKIKYSYICFYGNGVKLCCEGSPLIEQLEAIEKMGTTLIICKTCLKYNNLLDKVKVGTVGTMGDILMVHSICSKIIKL